MVQNNFPPQAYLFGAAKSGTTSLAHILGQHPQICLSAPKEPQFYWTNWEEGFEWYRQRFSGGAEKILLDASQGYSMAPWSALRGSPEEWPVPKRIYEARPDARLIYIVRDPVDRAVSNYWHARRYWEKLSLEEAIEEKRPYLLASLYYRQVELFRAYFSEEQFLFLSFDDLKSNPDNTVRQCAEFLRVEAQGFEVRDTRARNQSYVSKPWADGIIKAIGRNEMLKRAVNGLKAILPDKVTRTVRSSMTETLPETSPETLSTLREMFAEDFERFQVSIKAHPKTE